MRKSLLCLTLLVGVFFMLGGTASASNCTYLASGPTIVSGAFYHGANVGACTDVNAIRLYGSAAQNAGWYDNTLSAQFGALIINSTWVYPGPPTYVTLGNVNGGTITNFSATYQTACWYGATTFHYLQTSFAYSLHSRAQNSWGLIHPFYTPNQLKTYGC